MHEFDRGVTKYDIMPIPPVEAHSERFTLRTPPLAGDRK